MADITYEIVEHNGGFAYKVGDVFSETFGTHRAAHEAAQDASNRQHLQGTPAVIRYQDGAGKWHEEVSTGENPVAQIEDDLPADLEAHDAHGRVLEESEVPNPDRVPIGDMHHRQG